MTEQQLTAVKTLIAFAAGDVQHLNLGVCPDSLEGPTTRDEDCPVCCAMDVAGTLVGDIIHR